MYLNKSFITKASKLIIKKVIKSRATYFSFIKIVFAPELQHSKSAKNQIGFCCQFKIKSLSSSTNHNLIPVFIQFYIFIETRSLTWDETLIDENESVSGNKNWCKMS